MWEENDFWEENNFFRLPPSLIFVLKLNTVAHIILYIYIRISASRYIDTGAIKSQPMKTIRYNDSADTVRNRREKPLSCLENLFLFLLRCFSVQDKGVPWELLGVGS